MFRTPEINARLKQALSKKKLTKYLAATEDNIDSAIGLYERNTRLSEALYTAFQAMEICLRNCIHFEMSVRYGADWITDGQAKLAPNSLRATVADIE